MPVPFTQWECEMAVWLADADGWPTSSLLWLGSCTNRSDFTQGYAEERAETSGVPWPDFKLLEQEHKVTLENLWALREDAGEPAMPGMERNQRGVAVFVWTDEDTGWWVKRTYYNAAFNPFNWSSAGQVFEGRVEMKAGWVVEEKGNLAVETPVLDAVKAGEVRYVSAAKNLALYRYDFVTGAYTPLVAPAVLAATAEIVTVPDATHLFYVQFAGVKSLGVTLAGVLQAKRFDFTGGTGSAGLPRLEFRVGPRRAATLTAAGLLSAPRFTEAAADPAFSEDLEFRDGAAWLASVDRTGVLAPALEDTL